MVVTELRISLSDLQARELERQAKHRGVRLEEYVLKALVDLTNGYPVGYFERAAGQWQGQVLEGEPTLELETRDVFDHMVA